MSVDGDISLSALKRTAKMHCAAEQSTSDIYRAQAGCWSSNFSHSLGFFLASGALQSFYEVHSYSHTIE